MCLWPPAKEAHPAHSYRGDLTVLFSRRPQDPAVVLRASPQVPCEASSSSTVLGKQLAFASHGMAFHPGRRTGPASALSMWRAGCDMLLPQLQAPWSLLSLTLSQKGLPRSSTDACLLSIIHQTNCHESSVLTPPVTGNSLPPTWQPYCLS